MLLMGKSTISMAIFNSKLLVYQRVTNNGQKMTKICGPLFVFKKIDPATHPFSCSNCRAGIRPENDAGTVNWRSKHGLNRFNWGKNMGLTHKNWC